MFSTTLTGIRTVAAALPISALIMLSAVPTTAAAPAREPTGIANHLAPSSVADTSPAPVPCFTGRESWNTGLAGPPPTC